MRRALTWLFVLPAIVAASQLAHGVAYWWAYPQANLRLTALASSGHGYLAYAPAALGFLGAVQLIAFALAAVDHARGRPARRLPSSVFLVMPVLGFVLQEHLERLLTSGVFPWWAAIEPSFWRGLVLQVPLGLLAYVVAALLLRGARAVADSVGALAASRALARIDGRSPSPIAIFLPRRPPLAGRAADRAPPVAA